jgi:hypothetical protein
MTRPTPTGTRKALLPASLAGAMVAAVALHSAGAHAKQAATPAPLVTVVSHGGVCPPPDLHGRGFECRWISRIDDRRITAGSIQRTLTPGKRLALLRAIATLDIDTIRAHPFRGLCPTAMDGQEQIYRFRGFPHRLPSCAYDLRHVRAVQLTERLLASLTPKS